MSDFFKSLVGMASEKINDVGRTLEIIGDNLTYGAKNTIENVSNTIDNINDGVSSSIKSSIEDVSNTANTIKDNVEYSTTSTFESVKKEMQSLGESIDYHLKSTLNDWSETQKNVSENVDRAMEDQAVKMAERVDTLEKLPGIGEPIKAAHKVYDTIQNINTQNNPIIAAKRYSETTDEDTFEFGDHLMQVRIGFTHHGIYIGGGKIIHSTIDGVVETTLDGFKDGWSIRKMSVQESPALVSPAIIVRNARSQLGKKEYDPITNNCEHFARWCRQNGN